MSGPLKVMVIGGRGGFGRRLVEGILVTTEFSVVIAGRDEAANEAYAAGLRTRFPTHPIAATNLDRSRITSDDLERLALFCVVDAAGPFQNQSPVVAQAAIAAGVHYLDLADARDFVAGFPRLDAEAKARGVVARTGASSTPALSNAVLDQLTAGWRRVDDVLVAITPGNRAPRGLAVVRSILSYSGQPVRLFRGGRWQTAHGWGLLRRQHIPGLGVRWLSLCETPDLDLIPARFAPTRSATFKAGLELPIMHVGLWLLGWLVRTRIVRSLTPLASSLTRIADWLEPFGTDCGGMIVQATGIDGRGARMRSTWTLLAEDGCGPSIPTLPALAALKALSRCELAPGAAAMIGDVPYETLAAEFARLSISVNWTQEPVPSAFQIALGEPFSRMPGPIRALHACGPAARFAGRADIDGPDGWVCRLVHRVMGLPPAGRNIAVAVDISEAPDPDDDGSLRTETWVRDFAGRRFSSRLAPRWHGASAIEERFGLIRFRLALAATEAGLTMVVARWWLGPIPMPRLLMPTTEAAETIDPEGRFSFDVAIKLPLFGRLVRYRGWLMPAEIIV
jgi:hypothetical protein